MIYEEIEAEREYQRQKWGNTKDNQASLNDWCAWISHHSTRWFNGGFAPYDKETVKVFRQQMIKTAALAVAAVEAIDRASID